MFKPLRLLGQLGNFCPSVASTTGMHLTYYLVCFSCQATSRSSHRSPGSFCAGTPFSLRSTDGKSTSSISSYLYHSYSCYYRSHDQCPRGLSSRSKSTSSSPRQSRGCPQARSCSEWVSWLATPTFGGLFALHDSTPALWWYGSRATCGTSWSASVQGTLFSADAIVFASRLKTVNSTVLRSPASSSPNL